MFYYYISCGPFLIYWLSCGFIELFVIEEKKKKYIINNVSKKDVFFNVIKITVSTIISNILIVYFNILHNEDIRIIYLLLGIWWIDTIEYFTHRYMHTNKFLYKKFHKVHHEMHDTYHYGALYNSSFEASITGSMLFAGIYLLGISYEEYIIITMLANVATVIDHTYINYKHKFHYLHHSVYHNYNYQQPFFTYYDRLLGTYKCD